MPDSILAQNAESLPFEMDGEVKFARRHINPDGTLGGWLYPDSRAHATSWIHPGAIVMSGVSVPAEARIDAPILVTDEAFS